MSTPILILWPWSSLYNKNFGIMHLAPLGPLQVHQFVNWIHAHFPKTWEPSSLVSEPLQLTSFINNPI